MKILLKRALCVILILSISVISTCFYASAKYDEDYEVKEFQNEYGKYYQCEVNGEYYWIEGCTNLKYNYKLGRPFYYIDKKYIEGYDNNELTVTFCPGDGTIENKIYTNIMEATCMYLPGVSRNWRINTIVFKSDFIVQESVFMQMSGIKNLILLNDAQITFYDHGSKDPPYPLFILPRIYVVYGTNENQRIFAEEILERPYYDLNTVILEPKEGSGINVDETNHIITGITPKTSTDAFLNDCLEPRACDAVIEKEGYAGTGDKVNLVKWLDDSDAGSYDILLYGDVDSDGIYDARDAYLVNLMANGLLTEEQVGSLKWSAADCNHDGLVDSSDVLILQKAGVLLAQVNQSESDTDVEENQAYQDYIELIDQNPTVEDQPVEEPEPEVQPASIIDRIIEFIKKVVDFFLSIISKF